MTTTIHSCNVNNRGSFESRYTENQFTADKRLNRNEDEIAYGAEVEPANAAGETTLLAKTYRQDQAASRFFLAAQYDYRSFIDSMIALARGEF